MTEDGDLSFSLSAGRATLIDYLNQALIIWDEPTDINRSIAAYQEKLNADLEALIEEGKFFPEQKSNFVRFLSLKNKWKPFNSLNLRPLDRGVKKAQALIWK